MVQQSRKIVYAALVGVFALMGAIVYYASLDNVHLEQAEITLASVDVINVDSENGQAKFNVTFLVKNPSEKTFTVAIIDYQLFTDDILLGEGEYSAIDVALPGRAIFYPGAEVPLKSTFVINESEVNSEIFESMINDEFNSFLAKGTITTQTSWSTIDKEFTTGF